VSRGRRLRGHSLVWLGWLLVSAAGCPSSGRTLGEECSSTGDCRDELQCLEGTCTPRCQTHAACGDGYLCDGDGLCNQVFSAIGDACRRELDCGPGQACALDAIDNDGDGVLAATCQADQPGVVTGGACEVDDDCRNHICALGRCTQLCIDDGDCPDLACVTLPRPGANSAPTFQGCLQDSGTLSTSIKMTAAHQEIRVAVPSNAISFAVIAEIDDDSQQVGASSIKSPSGDDLYLSPNEPAEFYENSVRHRHTNSISTIVIPTTPLVEIETGAYLFEIGSFFELGGNGTAIPEVTVIYKLGSAATLKLHLNFLNLTDHPCPEVGDLNAASAQGMGDFRSAYVSELQRIMTNAGINLATTDITYRDIDNRPDLDGLDLDDLADLLRLDDQADGISIFFVRSINPTGILAVAGGNPGPPLLSGSAASGIAVSVDTLCYREWNEIARASAHEIARYLGLFRNLEPDGYSDPIPGGSEPANLMYFSEEPGGTALSAGQKAVLQLYPGLR
jgi:hypothetical protein